MIFVFRPVERKRFRLFRQGLHELLAQPLTENTLQKMKKIISRNRFLFACRKPKA